ncbi:MAG: rRNA maturation RNase YbeY, partial [Candidatus Omnitrophica bacterium]|nr:rRNA maturation RNase YbeY [Candidatus Omnitrophota bacterium]
DQEDLKKVVKKTLDSEGVTGDVGVNLLLTGDKKITALNKRFLGRNEPTDVISFGTKTRLSPSKNLKGFLGEIVISLEIAEYNAKRFGTTVKKEIFLYVIHGVLHLMGYGDKTKKEQRIIQEKQNKVLETLCSEPI